MGAFMRRYITIYVYLRFVKFKESVATKFKPKEGRISPFKERWPSGRRRTPGTRV